MEEKGGPSASGIVYLFGDRFVDKSRLGGERLLYGGVKVRQRDLANQLMLSAFVELTSDGYLNLEPFERRRLRILVQRDVTVTVASEPRHTLYGLEGAIWENISGDPDRDRAKRIIRGIIGGRCSNPWWVIVERAKEGLLEQGYLVTEKEERRLRPDKIHWSANEELVAPLEGRVDQVKAMFDSFEVGNPAVHSSLVRAVKNGISAMEETTDYD